MPFAGYEMPLQYRLGILKEHLHVRAAAGLFDVSHMGQLAVRPRSGRMKNAALALELAEHAYLLETGHIVMDAPAAVIGADEGVRRAYLGY